MKIITLKIVLIVALCTTFSASYAQVQKWVDKDGKVHYGSFSPTDVDSQSMQSAPITYSHGTSRVELPKDEELSRNISKPNPVNSDLSYSGPAILYATSWCGYCKKARAYMAQNGIAYKEFDIENDRNARSEYRRHRGEGVPLLVMGEKTLRGFSADRYDQFFEQSFEN